MDTDTYIGMIGIFAGHFAPKGWAFCEGQTLNVYQNQALFSVIGAAYGGDGKNTFMLPDLRGVCPIHFGATPGLTNRNIGAKVGEPSVALTANQIPAHTHTATASSGPGNANLPSNAIPANTGPDAGYAAGPTSGTFMNQNFVQTEGASHPHNNMQPFLALRFVIAITGLYPSKNY